MERIARGAEKWESVLLEIPKLAEGMALPVEFQDKAEALRLQLFILARNRDGLRYAVRRLGLTVYISKVKS